MGDHVVILFVFGCLLVAIIRLAKFKFGKEAPAPIPAKEIKKGPSLLGGILFLIIIVIVAMGISSLGFNGILAP